MDTTADDNFFIEEPQKLRNNFFDKDKSIQMVELYSQANRDSQKKLQLNRIQTCRLTPSYNKKSQKHQQLLQQHNNATMPRSFITRLEILCEATYNTDDISVATRAVDTLVNASKSGCCFLERYIVMLLNFCTKTHPLTDDKAKIKVEELLNRVLIVDFDRQQLTENLRRAEYKLTSVEHIVHLLRRVQDMLDYREQTAVNWLTVLLDAYFVELATTDEAAEIIEHISAHINFQCALLREAESTRCLLKSILEHLNSPDETNKMSSSSSSNVNHSRHKRPYYSIESIEF